MTDLEATDGAASGSRGIGALLGGLGLVAALTVGALALDSGTPAAATGLEQFDSCAELEAWTEDLQSQGGIEVAPTFAAEEESGRAGEDVAAGAGAAADTAESSTAGQAAPLAADGDDATGGTNTVVEGVDEIDVIDRVADDRLLVSRNGVLALVELSTLTVVAEVGAVPFDARISAADGVVFVAGSSYDEVGRSATDVRRIRIDGDSLVEDGSWSTPGSLLDARRTGDRLHVVVVDQPYEFGAVPFEGGPVPCDQVWRPVEPATSPAATLVASLPVDGGLAPTAIAEITGAGGNLLVTDGAAYVVTETYGAEDGSVTSGIHRFDLATLAPTGSGAVPGSVAGPFALSEHEGHLRVATSRTGGFGGRPIPIEGDGGIGVGGVAVDPAVSGPAVDVAEAAPAQAPAEEVAPEATTTTVEGTEPTEPTVTLPVEETTTTAVPETTTTVPETTTTEAPTTTVPADESALAEVFVLDIDGDLDVVGTTGRFGREFETIHGVRFVGDVAYVVTFLQTDPFWVIDLADQARPVVVGELQIPGFSGYLHPVGDDRVVGFGPDGAGQVAARLFDVADPSAPAVIDEITLGDDSPVAFDHHAFVSLAEGRFAVPVSDYPDYVEGDCVVVGEPIPRPQVEPLPADDPGSTSGGGTTGIAVGEPVPDCAPPEPIGGGSGAVVLEVVDGRLQEVERPMIERADLYAERVVQAPDGTWIVLGYDRLASTVGGRELVLPAA
jgi:uncharacterized secreted protein with C-terminal beta-propeller domain